MIYVIIGVLGLCLGSFVNAWVWRRHEQTKQKAKRVVKDVNLSILKGRSVCTHCKHRLNTFDLIPVLSWIGLKGKCRYCRKPISWHYPFIELLTALLFIVAYIAIKPSLSSSVHAGMFLLVLTAIVVGAALALYDFLWMTLPNKMVVVLASIGILYVALNLFVSESVTGFLINLVTSLLLSGGLFYILFQVSNGRWIGGGDVKLGVGLGLLLLTPLNAAIMLFLSSLLGTLYAVLLMVLGKYSKGVRVPFGPFLLLATYIVVLFGNQLIESYKKLLLI